MSSNNPFVTVANSVNATLKTLFGVPWQCPDGYDPDPLFGNGICYRRCDEGYRGISFTCWPDCSQQTVNSVKKIYPNGWTDLGLSCKKNAYFRGSGGPQSGCAQGEYTNGSCYAPCEERDGFETEALLTNPRKCVAKCPEGTVSGGLNICNKLVGSEYGRGAGNQGDGCPSGYTNLGLFCYNFSQLRSSGFQCPNNCIYGPKNGNNGLNGRPCSYWYGTPNTSPCFGTPNPYPDDDFFNTVLSPINQRQCEENWGWLCYPKCDVKKHPFGCCICSPDCTNMVDNGFYCANRYNYDRGGGSPPGQCFDPDTVAENGICRTPCTEGFAGFGESCAKTGCPDHTTEGLFGLCYKVPYVRDTTLGTPSVASLLNRKLNLGTTGDVLKQAFFNFAVAIGAFLLLLGVYLLSFTKAKTSTISKSL